MSVLALAPAVALVLGCAGLVALARRRSAQHLPRSVTDEIAAWRWAGLLVGLVAATTAAKVIHLGLGALLTAPLVALGALAGVVAGQRTVAPPRTPRRRAALAARHASDLLPRALTAGVAAAWAALVALGAATTALASPDDLGRAGRAIAHRCGDTASSRSPWPGSWYALPLAGALLVVVALAALALRSVADRPAPVDPADPASGSAADAAERRAGGRAVVGACGVAATVPLVGMSLLTAMGLLGTACRPLAWSVGGWASLALVPVWLGVLAASAAALLAPGGARGVVPAVHGPTAPTGAGPGRVAR